MKETMAHLLTPMYVDEIDFEAVTIEKIVDLVFTEMIHDKMQQLEKEELAKQDQTDGNQWSTSQYSEWTTQRCNMSPYVYTATSQFSVSIGQKMQLTG